MATQGIRLAPTATGALSAAIRNAIFFAMSLVVVVTCLVMGVMLVTKYSSNEGTPVRVFVLFPIMLGFSCLSAICASLHKINMAQAIRLASEESKR